MYNRYVSSLQFDQRLWNVPSQSFPAECTLWSLPSIRNAERTCVCVRIKLKVHNYLHSATGCAVNLSRPNAATQGKQCEKANMIGVLMVGDRRGGRWASIALHWFVYLFRAQICLCDWISRNGSRFSLDDCFFSLPTEPETAPKVTSSSTLIGYSVFKIWESHDGEKLSSRTHKFSTSFCLVHSGTDQRSVDRILQRWQNFALFLFNESVRYFLLHHKKALFIIDL